MKILVSDFDFTFYDDHYEENITLVNQFVKQGNCFIIATNRNYGSLMDDLIDTGLDYEYLICSGGAVIYDKNGNLVFEQKLDLALSKELYKLYQNASNYHEVLYDHGDYYGIDFDNQIYRLMARPYKIDRAMGEMQEVMEHNPSVYVYLSKYWVNIVDKRVSKGNALEVLIQKNQYDRNMVYTIGDDYNDLDLLKNYQGYCIKNGNEEVVRQINRQVETFQECLSIIQEKTSI